jgi:hypothetical protein
MKSLPPTTNHDPGSETGDARNGDVTNQSEHGPERRFGKHRPAGS